MLAVLEGKLESLLASMSSMEPGYVLAKAKERERERRALVKAARLKAAAEAADARQAKMLARAQAPVLKRVGKPIM
jgi:hypothetical protein